MPTLAISAPRTKTARLTALLLVFFLGFAVGTLVQSAPGHAAEPEPNPEGSECWVATEKAMNTLSWVMHLGQSAPVTSCSQPPTIFRSSASSLFSPGFHFKCSPDQDVGCSGLFPSHSASETQIAPLINGEDSLAARIQSIRDAKRSIRIQALIFSGDESGIFLANMLKAKKAANPNMDIRIIVDGFSNPDLQTQALYFDLLQHGIPVEGFMPLYTQWVNEVSLKDPRRPNMRFHDKLWIVDGEDPKSAVAISGGLNVANEYFRMGAAKPGKGDSKKRWRDQDIMIKGAAIKDMVTTFDRNFADCRKIMNSRPGLLNGEEQLKVWQQTILKHFGTFNIPYRTSQVVMDRVRAVADRAENAHYDFVPAQTRFIQSRPRKNETFIMQAYVDQIDQSDEIVIENAYFVPTPSIEEALKRAVRRGAHVRILTNSFQTHDLPPLCQASRFSYQDLMAANFEEESKKNGGSIRIDEWHGERYGMGTLHAKFAVFGKRGKDGKPRYQTALVGSYNLDPRSESLNSETMMAIDSLKLAGTLAGQVLGEDMAKATEITWQQAQKFHDPKHSWEKLGLGVTLKLQNTL